IGAIVLYVLASGSVKGFAFFLGLATLLDLAVSYFFMHPLVVILSRRRALVRVPVVGIASGLDPREAAAWARCPAVAATRRPTSTTSARTSTSPGDHGDGRSSPARSSLSR